MTCCKFAINEQIRYIGRQDCWVAIETIEKFLDMSPVITARVEAGCARNISYDMPCYVTSPVIYGGIRCCPSGDRGSEFLLCLIKLRA